MHLGGVAREVHGGLAGGVGAADEVNLLLGAGHGFGLGGAVVDAGSGEAVRAGDVEQAVGDAGGDEADVAGELAVIAHADDVVAVLAADVGDALGEELGAEAVGLEEGALGELVAGEALGEAEIVLDARAGAGLAADGVGLDDKGAQAFGGAVDARGEPGGTGADDDDVVESSLAWVRRPMRVGEFRGGGLDHGGAVAEEDDGELGVVEALFFQQIDGLGHAFRVEPLVLDAVAGEEVADRRGRVGDQRRPMTRMPS